MSIELRKPKVGLIGFGTVGTGFYQLYQSLDNPSFEIKKIVVRDSTKPRSVEEGLVSFDTGEVLEDEEIEVVVEVIDDCQEAYRIIKASLLAGKKVVSANKKVIAENLEEFIALQKDGAALLYEASVCAGIPIICELESTYRNESFLELKGILNGSCNYILSKIYKEGLGYSEALKDAQKKGFAESNPSLDVEGYDAKYKLIILVAHAFGLILQPNEVINFGIQHTERAVGLESQSAIKLIAQCTRSGGSLVPIVSPAVLEGRDLNLGVEDEYNSIKLTGEQTGIHFKSGKGAGSLPTGLAVLADVERIIAGFRYNYAKLKEKDILEVDHDALVNVRVDAKTLEEIPLNVFQNVNTKCLAKSGCFVYGTIYLKSLNELRKKGISVAITDSPRFWNEDATSSLFFEGKKEQLPSL